MGQTTLQQMGGQHWRPPKKYCFWKNIFSYPVIIFLLIIKLKHIVFGGHRPTGNLPVSQRPSPTLSVCTALKVVSATASDCKIMIVGNAAVWDVLIRKISSQYWCMNFRELIVGNTVTSHRHLNNCYFQLSVGVIVVSQLRYSRVSTNNKMIMEVVRQKWTKCT